MRTLIFIILSFSPLLLFGQQLFFHHQRVDSILIKSDERAWQGGNLEKGTAEYLEIGYNKKKKDYRISSYTHDEYKIKFNLGSMEDSVKVATRTFGSYTDKRISNRKLQNLLTAFSLPRTTSENVRALELANYGDMISERQIRKVAKWFGEYEYFDPENTTREQSEQFFKSCQSQDTLLAYLESEEFDTSYVRIETDYSNTMEVKIVTEQTRHLLYGRGMYPTRQPWVLYSEVSTYPASYILNVDINRLLPEILPEKFFLRDRISLQKFMDAYIHWCIGRRFYEED